MSEERFYTTREAAEALRVTHRTIRAWIKQGRLTAVWAGASMRIPAAQIAAFLKPVKNVA